jgi:hypothetical protein
MAGVKISNLPAATVPLTGAELIAVVQGGATKQAAIGGTIPAAQIINTPTGTIAATNVQAAINEIVTDLSASSGSSLVGFIQTGTGATARTGQAKLRETVSVKDFGAVGDGTTNDTTAIQAAIDSITDDGVLIVPPGTYKLTSTLVLGAASKGARIVGIGVPTFNFVGLGATADGIQIVGAGYRQTQIENLIVNLNSVGRDGIRLQAGDHPIIQNVRVQNTKRHGFAIICAGYEWVENGKFSIECDDIGASAFYLELSGANGAFINESLFELCEVRGVSLLSNNGAAVYASSGGTLSGSKMSGIRWVNCNFDAQRQKSVTNGFDVNEHPMYLAYVVGATNTFESWHIDTGGWETTSANPDFRSLGLVYCDPLSLARGFNIQNIVPGGWSGGGYVGLVDYVIHDIQYGVFRAQYPNSWKQQGLVASTTYDFDIPLPNPLVSNTNLARNSVAAAYELSFFHTTFAATNQEAYKQDLYITYFLSGGDTYGVLYGASSTTLVGLDQFTINTVTVLNATGGATLAKATPPAIVRLNVTTTANWGAGGGDGLAYGIVMYKGASNGSYSA